MLRSLVGSEMCIRDSCDITLKITCGQCVNGVCSDKITCGQCVNGVCADQTDSNSKGKAQSWLGLQVSPAKVRIIVASNNPCQSARKSSLDLCTTRPCSGLSPVAWDITLHFAQQQAHSQSAGCLPLKAVDPIQVIDSARDGPPEADPENSLLVIRR